MGCWMIKDLVPAFFQMHLRVPGRQSSGARHASDSVSVARRPNLGHGHWREDHGPGKLPGAGQSGNRLRGLSKHRQRRQSRGRSRRAEKAVHHEEEVARGQKTIGMDKPPTRKDGQTADDVKLNELGEIGYRCKG